MSIDAEWGLAMRVEKHRNIRMPLRLVLCLKVKTFCL
jgi:hypothetical protein